MKSLPVFAVLLPLVMGVFSWPAPAQERDYLPRLPPERLDITPPTRRVSGEPGAMEFLDQSCRTLPMEMVRRRIVNAAVQEWAFFGFTIEDEMDAAEREFNRSRRGRRFFRRDREEPPRVASSIAGYWAVTPDSGWILRQQNELWNGSRDVDSGWRQPWSAAFVSWVMCESGLGDPERFNRSVAHHTYIDQAILARETSDSPAAFTAYDAGEQPLVPGDMLCRGSRPRYSSIAERRAQIGEAARTHCDIVVEVDEAAGRVLAIGGNVEDSVTMKLLPVIPEDSGHPVVLSGRGRPYFAHLRLNAPPIEVNALDQTPTREAMNCGDFTPPESLASTDVSMEPLSRC